MISGEDVVSFAVSIFTVVAVVERHFIIDVANIACVAVILKSVLIVI